MTPEREQPELKDEMSADLDRLDAILDEALQNTFPASDPVAISFEDRLE